MLYSAALRSGFVVSRKTDEARIRKLIAKLHPVKTDTPLIRLGGPADGGYLVPDDLEGLSACFSPGVDVTATFEMDLVRRGIPCFLADASVAAAPVSDPLIDFAPKFVGVDDDERYVTMDSWVNAKFPGGDDSLILQMDIEGGEWPVLLNMSDELLQRFRVIVLELHGLPDIFNMFAFNIQAACIGRLTKYFNVVHLHPNNVMGTRTCNDISIPYFLEMTLHRKDRAQVMGYATSFPHPLDASNISDRAPMALPRVFHS